MLENIHAFILAGGESRRFGKSENKAFFLHWGRALILYPAEKLSRHFSEVTIIAKEKNEFEKFGYPVIQDEFDVQNPLIGIYTGLKFTTAEWNFFAACDMPLLSSNVILKLTEQVPQIENDILAIVPKTESGFQPLCAMYHRSVISVIEEQQHQVDSLKGLIRHIPAKIVEFKSDKPFTNVNTFEELQQLH